MYEVVKILISKKTIHYSACLKMVCQYVHTKWMGVFVFAGYAVLKLNIGWEKMELGHVHACLICMS
jgi:hypothetical protein